MHYRSIIPFNSLKLNIKIEQIYDRNYIAKAQYFQGANIAFLLESRFCFDSIFNVFQRSLNPKRQVERFTCKIKKDWHEKHNKMILLSTINLNLILSVVLWSLKHGFLLVSCILFFSLRYHVIIYFDISQFFYHTAKLRLQKLRNTLLNNLPEISHFAGFANFTTSVFHKNFKMLFLYYFAVCGQNNTAIAKNRAFLLQSSNSKGIRKSSQNFATPFASRFRASQN